MKIIVKILKYKQLLELQYLSLGVCFIYLQQ
jgi:hypothetical protein